QFRGGVIDITLGRQMTFTAGATPSFNDGADASRTITVPANVAADSGSTFGAGSPNQTRVTNAFASATSFAFGGNGGAGGNGLATGTGGAGGNGGNAFLIISSGTLVGGAATAAVPSTITAPVAAGGGTLSINSGAPTVFAIGGNGGVGGGGGTAGADGAGGAATLQAPANFTANAIGGHRAAGEPGGAGGV